MPGPGLIGDYLTELSADLLGGMVKELADGLDETHRPRPEHYCCWRRPVRWACEEVGAVGHSTDQVP
jgi:hypothetical protein